MKRTPLKLSIIAALVFAGTAHAQEWSFKNVSVNYLDWTGRTERTTGKGFAKKKDFMFLEVEGGLGGKWGELYGFFDLENPTRNTREADATSQRRQAWKVSGRFNLTKVGDLPVQAYAHVYDFAEDGFNDQSRVVGLGTSYSNGAGFWIKPFIGVHQSNKSTVSGIHVNGGMAGWVLGYGFKLAGQSLMVTNWHETEFMRKDEYLFMADAEGGVKTGSKTGHNGAVSLWWNVTPEFTTGVQYRYASNKLGSATYQDAFILTAKYNF